MSYTGWGRIIANRGITTAYGSSTLGVLSNQMTTELWVSKQGNDGTADGSPAKSFASGIAAIAYAKSNLPTSTNKFIIKFAPGTYNESSWLIIDNVGYWAADRNLTQINLSGSLTFDATLSGVTSFSGISFNNLTINGDFNLDISGLIIPSNIEISFSNTVLSGTTATLNALNNTQLTLKFLNSSFFIFTTLNQSDLVLIIIFSGIFLCTTTNISCASNTSSRLEIYNSQINSGTFNISNINSSNIIFSLIDTHYITLPIINLTDLGVGGILNYITDADSYVIPSSITGSPIINLNTVNPYAIYTFDKNITSVNLSSAASVILRIKSSSHTFVIRGIILNSNGTNFSGGGGNRDLQITDGVTVYSVIPAAILQALVNAQWGSISIPFPVSSAINTPTAADHDLVAKYSGGTTDYSAGSLSLTIQLQEVT